MTGEDKMTAYGFNTSLLHGTKDDNPFWGDSGAGFYQSSAFRHASAEGAGWIFANKAMGFSLPGSTIPRSRHLKRE